MYVGIDIGGTKTLVASLDEHGVITEKIRFKTAQDYDEQLQLLQSTFNQLQVKDFKAGGAGVPGILDRKHHRVEWFGNLNWKNLPMWDDLERITGCPMVVENDAKLAGLSEAMLVKHEYDKVLYITISTGVGIGLIEDRKIVTAVSDAGGATIPFEHLGKLYSWDRYLSGSAIVERYGKTAEELDDPKIWRTICRDWAKVIVELVAILDPQVVVIGGSVGTHFNKYCIELNAQLAAYHTPVLQIPPIRQAGRPEEAVLFGCYDLAKETFSADAR